MNKNVIFLFFFVVLYGYIAVLCGKDVGWDFLNYHLYNGYAFIYHRLGIDYAPAVMWSFFNPLLDALNFLIIITFSKAKLVSFVFGAVCGLGAFIYYKTVDLFFAKDYKPSILYIVLACLIGLTGPTCISQIGSAQNDFQSAIFVILALYFALKSIIEQRAKFIFFAGLSCGIALGLKLTSAPYIVAMLLATFVSTKARLKWSFYFGLGGILGFLLTNGWLVWILYQKFASPFFPCYNAIFHSPYFPDYNLAAFGVKTITQVITYPYRFARMNNLAAEFLLCDWRLAVSFSFILIFLLVKTLSCFSKKEFLIEFRNKEYKPWALFLTVFLVVSYVLWIKQFLWYRYAIPIQLVSGVLIVYYYQLLFPTNLISKIGLIVLSLFIVHKTFAPAFPRSPAVGNYIEVNAPQALPEHSMVIITALGQSFVIPFFPRYVIFSSPSLYYGTDFSPGIEAILKHTGPLFVLISDNPPYPFTDPLGFLNTQKIFQFKVEQTQCNHFTTNVPSQPGFKLCPIQILKS